MLPKETTRGLARRWRRGLRRSAMVAAGLALASCLVTPQARTPAAMTAVAASVRPPSRHTVVVVVALDGVRWQDVFEGVDPKLAQEKGLAPHEVVRPEQLMPNLHEIVSTRGAALGAPGHGAPMTASGPNYVSLPGYIEMLSGKESPCHSNECNVLLDRTLADDFAEVSQGWATEVAVIASWPDLAKAAGRNPERMVVSAGRHGGATRRLLRFDAESAWLFDTAAREKPHPGHGDFRPDRYTAALALRYLRKQNPRFLFLSLGEPDAWAHRGHYRQYLASIAYGDAVIGEIEQHLAGMRARGHSATLLVTTDHGRGRHFAGHGAAPESGRVWLVATGSGIHARGWVMAPRERRLADIAPTVRALAGLEAAESSGSPLDELLGPRG